MIHPQLAEKIKISRIDKYLTDDQWWMTQKLDGERLVVVVDDGKISGINRSGGFRPVPPAIGQLFKGWPGQWVFDGELIGASYWVFDVPIALTRVGLSTPYHERVDALDIVPVSPSVQRLTIAKTTEEKVRLAKRCIENNAEGMMLNRIDAPYIQGPPRSPYLLKAKLVTTAEVIVAEVGREGKRSIGVTVYDGDTLIPYKQGSEKESGIGAVTVTDSVLDSLHVGDVVEVKYLYMTKDRKLYQASFLRPRPDRTPESCSIEQCKFGNKEVLV